MKILFVSYNDIDAAKTGGEQCSRRNYQLLRNSGDVDYIGIKKISSLQSALSVAHLYFPPLSRKKIVRILYQIKQKGYDLIYLDSSLFGILASKIKKTEPDAGIVTFFHNVEVDYNDVRIRKGIKNSVYKALAKRNEELSVKYADKIIALNTRDRDRIEELYSRRADFILPITFENVYKKIPLLNISKMNDKKIGLFVGSLVNANYDSLIWFLKNSSMLDYFELQVVGKNFETVRERLEKYHVTVIGTVEDITPYYENADFVLSPIQYGSGMKVKIAEALMYGKTVLGTDEAFEGYYDESGEALILCNSIDEFDREIEKIIHSAGSRFNKMSMKLFEEKYSNEAYSGEFRKIIMSLQR